MINTTTRISKPTFILDDIRQTVHMMEPSAHKRKRESHPLSDEMFISSTCARTRPFLASGSLSCKLSKNMTVHQQTSQSSANSGVCAGNSKQFHDWYKSIVCLKSRAPPSSQDQDEEDVKEEDEMKLLEFVANCNWKGAKTEILIKVAQCLHRGQYPQPRTMNVCEFVVEILPKALQPSHVPPELRASLPAKMYSIRIRITLRQSVSCSKGG